jgi:hypothetical protein
MLTALGGVETNCRQVMHNIWHYNTCIKHCPCCESAPVEADEGGVGEPGEQHEEAVVGDGQEEAGQVGESQPPKADGDPAIGNGSV